MGGPMGVYEQDRYPFLRAEMRLIEQTLKSGKPVLCVCLGSQLIAAALDAPVGKGLRKEIGWHSVRLTKQAASYHASLRASTGMATCSSFRLARIGWHPPT